SYGLFEQVRLKSLVICRFLNTNRTVIVNSLLHTKSDLDSFWQEESYIHVNYNNSAKSKESTIWKPFLRLMSQVNIMESNCAYLTKKKWASRRKHLRVVNVPIALKIQIQFPLWRQR
ncbi:16832_t:CDS:2, partial [Acaulospora morrowiae]